MVVISINKVYSKLSYVHLKLRFKILHFFCNDLIEDYGNVKHLQANADRCWCHGMLSMHLSTQITENTLETHLALRRTASSLVTISEENGEEEVRGA